MRRAIVLFLGLLCISGFFESAATQSIPFKAINCVSGGDNAKQEEKTANHTTLSYFKPLSGAVNLSCEAAYWIGGAIHEQHEAIEALGVVVTAFFTATLWASTRALQKAAVKQGSDTERLFVQDQRPWIKVGLKTDGSQKPIFKQDGSLTLPLRAFVENIGKTPAFDAADGIGIHIGYEGFEEEFQSIRRYCEAQSLGKGKTIFPGEKFDFDASRQVSAQSIVKSRTIDEGRPLHFVTIGYRYRSRLVETPLEIIRMYKFGVGSLESALPDSEMAAGDRKVVLYLWKELIS